jgi:RNA polymerase sigma-70 factor (ECF subfamily)
MGVEACQITYRIAMVAKKAIGHIRSRSALPESQLVERSKHGDRDAFGEIVRRYQAFVYRQAWAYLRDDDAARDIAQDVFIKAYRSLRYLRGDEALRPWLYRICRNRCLNVIRRRRVEGESVHKPVVAGNSDVTLRLTLQRSISRLDDPYREVVMLRYYNDLTYGEIAGVLGISISNVKVRLFRAKKMLKAMLEGQDL